jgi:hypothetical protein
VSTAIRDIEKYLEDGFDIIRVERSEAGGTGESLVWLGDVMGKVDKVAVRLQDEEDAEYVRRRLGRTG